MCSVTQMVLEWNRVNTITRIPWGPSIMLFIANSVVDFETYCIAQFFKQQRQTANAIVKPIATDKDTTTCPRTKP